MAPPLRIDVSQQRCPMTWVRTKLALESLEAGVPLEVLLGDGPMLVNVPQSAREAGHSVAGPSPCGDGRYLITILKRGIA